TLYIDVTVWNRTAENCCQYLKKGRSVHVEGYLKMDSWDDKTTGEKRTKIKVEGEGVQFLDRREESGGGGAAPAADDYAPPAGREPRRPPAPGPGNGAGRPAGPNAPMPRR